MPKTPEIPKKERTRLKLVPKKLSFTQNQLLRKEKFQLFGREYDAKERCPPETVIQSGNVEFFSIVGHPGYRVVLCTDHLDGTPNVVSIYTQDQRVKSKTVSPKHSSYRIEDSVLLRTVKGLLKEFSESAE